MAFLRHSELHADCEVVELLLSHAAPQLELIDALIHVCLLSAGFLPCCVDVRNLGAGVIKILAYSELRSD